MFVAINYISCQTEYRSRFEQLFASRAGAIDHMPGFVRMKVLRPTKQDERYLIVSEWHSEQAFKDWSKSDAFTAGHKRGFADLEAARARGDEPPMRSEFRTYEVITE
ncbi:MAG: antibiotic biosynthesis monooxygenase [candidate division Zixibacteria bacterium]|nr:antibiotic biosynthesis monooxygenase [candidate division Zixibacteria bacterium]MDH3937556.1 antibiotic biosynthesis monooxygenase [candidate division Zixibacteria bacterium]MDH4034988.1 antibiotic biosynthesis monooxygenase [candidate division Zixibacteria bacterium]